MKPRQRGSYRSKQLGPSKIVGVRMDEASWTVFKKMSEINGWGIGAAVRYCAEHYLGIEEPVLIVSFPKGTIPNPGQGDNDD